MGGWVPDACLGSSASSQGRHRSPRLRFLQNSFQAYIVFLPCMKSPLGTIYFNFENKLGHSTVKFYSVSLNPVSGEIKLLQSLTVV